MNTYLNGSTLEPVKLTVSEEERHGDRIVRLVTDALDRHDICADDAALPIQETDQTLSNRIAWYRGPVDRTSVEGHSTVQIADCGQPIPVPGERAPSLSVLLAFDDHPEIQERFQRDLEEIRLAERQVQYESESIRLD